MTDLPVTSTAAPALPSDERAAVGFLLRLGRALHSHGLPADALENALQAMSERLGLEANFFTTPTSIFAAFGPPEQQHTHLIRVFPGDVDLGKLARLDAVSRDVEHGRIAVLEGSARIDAIMAMPQNPPPRCGCWPMAWRRPRSAASSAAASTRSWWPEAPASSSA